MRDWYLSPEPMRDNVAATMKYQASIDAIARERGSFFLGHYEGGNHDNASNVDMKACPQMREFLNDWQHGPDAAAVQNAFNDRFVSAYPDAVISNYIYRADRYDPAKPWFDLKPTETTNPYYQVWETLLRPPVSER
ncbi:MAG: hypothetical protein KDA46_07535, partial [Parvularculaceae bacterium]|nr:hypothetical protein [Parvularculaceae bacterium]